MHLKNSRPHQQGNGKERGLPVETVVRVGKTGADRLELHWRGRRKGGGSMELCDPQGQ